MTPDSIRVRANSRELGAFYVYCNRATPSQRDILRLMVRCCSSPEVLSVAFHAA
jgi:hypothetical protein